MRILKPALLAAGLISSALLSLPAAAHDYNDINRIQARQIQDIDNARRSGQLTRREYHMLMAEQARIANMEASAKADGRVSWREHEAIRDAQRAARVHIEQQSHDGEVNVWRQWKWTHGYR